MEITCNDQKRVVEPDTVLATLLRDLDLDPDTVAVECDGVILQRRSYEDTVLREGMVLEVIRFVGGGASC
jgi:thiamine biosynthesis protein ThiS